jgi:hypothetical protein
MTAPDEQPVPDPRRVRPYAMTGGRTRPVHEDLEIEALVSTTSMVEQAPKLTVEQRAIAALCQACLYLRAARIQLGLLGSCDRVTHRAATAPVWGDTILD